MEHYQLKQRQILPLAAKENMTSRRITEWYNHYEGDVYVSFSGGKDSTVLLDLVRRQCPEVPAVFVDTGLEFPEIKKFVETIDNVTCLKPSMVFTQVIKDYGYPVISKENAQKIYEIRTTKSDKLRNKRLYGDDKGNGKLSEKWKYMIDAPFKISSNCCNIMKKNPVKKYEKRTGRKPFVGTMAYESSLRTTAYLKNNGCNTFESKRPMSTPLSFWVEQDIWDYIEKYNLPYSEIYDKGYDRTGCIFCMFGVHLEKKSRFDNLKETHPKLHSYCMDKLGCRKVLDYLERGNDASHNPQQRTYSMCSRGDKQKDESRAH